MMHYEISPELAVVPSARSRRNAPHTRVVLEELFVLLEDYAPMWYTQEQRDRVLSALIGNAPRNRRVSNSNQSQIRAKAS